jgi:hypothetical protein
LHPESLSDQAMNPDYPRRFRVKKTIAIASLAALALIAGCASSSKTDSGNMGVVGSEKAKGSCCTQKADEGSMGVVSDAKAGTCETKSSCSTGATCPMTGAKSDKQN